MDTLRKFDLFGTQVPSFKLQGKNEIKSLVGAFASLLLIGLTFMYGVAKLQEMLLRKYMDISTNSVELDQSVSYDINHDDFMMAFSAQAY